MALGCFLISIIIGVYAVRIASLDTQAKILRMVESIDSDIAKLKEKLPTDQRAR